MEKLLEEVSKAQVDVVKFYCPAEVAEVAKFYGKMGFLVGFQDLRKRGRKDIEGKRGGIRNRSPAISRHELRLS